MINKRLAIVLILLAILVSVGLSYRPLFVIWLIFFGTALLPFIKRERSVKDPVSVLYAFVIYFFIGMGVRGLCLKSGMVYNHYLAPIHDDGLVAFAYLLSIMALLVLYVGYYYLKADRLGMWLSDKLSSTGRIDEILITIFPYICAAFGYFSLYLFYAKYGYLIRFGENPSAVVAASLGGGIYYITMLAHFPVVGALMSMGESVRTTRKLLFLCNCLVIILWFAIAGRKGLLVEFLLGGIIVYHYQMKNLSKKALATIGAFFWVIVSAMFYYRALGITDLSRWSDMLSEKGSLASAILNPIIQRSYHFDMFLIVLDQVDFFRNLKLGRTFSELFYFYIPRAWWPEKPVAFGYSFGMEYLDPLVYYKASYATSLPGELFMNFHVFGIFGGFLLLGIVMRALYIGLTSSRSQIPILIYSLIFVRLVQLAEGPIAVHVIFFMSTLLPFVLYFILRMLLNLRRA